MKTVFDKRLFCEGTALDFGDLEKHVTAEFIKLATRTYYTGLS